MIIKNGLVWEESGSFLTKDLHIDSDTHRIAMDSADTADDTIIDASGLYVIPGLVDIHIHGAMGCDFSDGSAEGLLKIAKYLRSCGVTAFCPTSMTLPENQLLTAFASTREIPDDNSHAFIAGIHMEGPFLSPEKKGAQKASYLRAPDIDMFRRLSQACDNKIRIPRHPMKLPKTLSLREPVMSRIYLMPCHHCITGIQVLSVQPLTAHMPWPK